jgi:hypothetical protein
MVGRRTRAPAHDARRLVTATSPSATPRAGDAIMSGAGIAGVVDRYAVSIVGALTVVAIALRAPGIATRSLWLDEAWRANVALASSWAAFWAEVLGGGQVEAPMPPGYAFLLRVIGLVCGRSPAALRMSSLVASVAAVPLAFLLGKRVYGALAGVAAAVCFACYPVAVTFGRELKPYALDVLVVLVLFLLAARVVARRDHRSWALLAISAALAPGLSYPAVLVLPGIAVGLLAVCRDRRDLGRWTVAQAFAAAAIVAWYVLVIAAQRARPINTTYWAASFPEFGRDGVAMVAEAGAELLAFAIGTPRWLFAIALMIGAVRAPRWFLLAGGGVVATVLAAGFLHIYPLSGGRTSLFLLPLLYVTIGGAATAYVDTGSGLFWRSRRDPYVRGPALRALGAAGASALLALPFAGAHYPGTGLVYEETAPLVARLEAERKPNERVYVYYGAVPAFRFYHPDLDPAITLGGSHRDDAHAYDAEIRPLIVGGERLWLLFAHVFTPASRVDEREGMLSELRVYGKQVEVRETAGASLHVFELTHGADRVRHIQISPEDAANPERLRELLGK